MQLIMDKLAEARADACRAALVARGVDAARLYVSYAAYLPIPPTAAPTVTGSTVPTVPTPSHPSQVQGARRPGRRRLHPLSA